MSDQRTDSLARLAPGPAAQSLKSEFFAMMPAIEAALGREVRWKAILAELERNGFTISPTLASNYAAQYRRRHRSAGEPGKPGRPRKSDSSSAVQVQSRTTPALVIQNTRPTTRNNVANLRRPPELD